MHRFKSLRIQAALYVIQNIAPNEHQSV